MYSSASAEHSTATGNTRNGRPRKTRIIWLRLGSAQAAISSSTNFDTYLALKDALSSWKFEDAAPVTERLRIVKSPEEVQLIRRAIAITEDAMGATFAQLAVGVSEQEVARLLASEMERRGAEGGGGGGGGGGGLVQFGASSALPHGGPAGCGTSRSSAIPTIPPT